MLPETLKRAKVIERQLGAVAAAQAAWLRQEETGYEDLGWLLDEGPVAKGGAVPVPVQRFRAACLDHLATKEQALRAELEAL